MSQKGAWGRDLLIYLARRRCGMKLAALGKAAGGLDYATVSVLVKRFERRLGLEARVTKDAEAAVLDAKL